MKHALWKCFVKRLFDIFASLAALIVLFPLLLLISLLILRESGRPVIFRQARVGKDSRLFLVCKFRTMRRDAPQLSKADFTQADAYITRIGRFIRATSLDELPQLWNILRGEMSVVGPRPLIPEEGEIHCLREKYHVYGMKPGMTGLAQVNGRDSISDAIKVQYDKQYVESFSLRLDMKILFKTVAVVLKRSDVAQAGESGETNPPPEREEDV